MFAALGYELLEKYLRRGKRVKRREGDICDLLVLINRPRRRRYAY